MASPPVHGSTAQTKECGNIETRRPFRDGVGVYEDGVPGWVDDVVDVVEERLAENRGAW